MYYTYILQSTKTKKHYVGSCYDYLDRLNRHNNGYVKSTKNGRPWKLIHLEQFLSREEAYKREMQIKRYKGGLAFKELINSI